VSLCRASGGADGHFRPNKRLPRTAPDPDSDGAEAGPLSSATPAYRIGPRKCVFTYSIEYLDRRLKHFPLTLAGTMRTVFLRPRDKKIAKNTAKTALLATAALAMPYAVTPSPLTVVCTAATAMVQNRAFHDFRAVGVPLAQVISSNIPG